MEMQMNMDEDQKSRLHETMSQNKTKDGEGMHGLNVLQPQRNTSYIL